MQQKTQIERKLNSRKRRNWSVQLEDLVERINPMVSVLQLDDQRDKTHGEKSENSRKVVSSEIVYFKIMKLFYNNSIYTKIF